MFKHGSNHFNIVLVCLFYNPPLNQQEPLKDYKPMGDKVPAKRLTSAERRKANEAQLAAKKKVNAERAAKRKAKAEQLDGNSLDAEQLGILSVRKPKGNGGQVGVKTGLKLERVIQLKLENPHLSQAQIAKLLGVSDASVCFILKRNGKSWADLCEGTKNFKENRADILAHLQREILAQINVEKLEKATAYQLCGMFSLLYDKERLERGQSTNNIGIWAQVIKQAAMPLTQGRTRQLLDKQVDSETNDKEDQ
jgi:predicted transcriptional regulator